MSMHASSVHALLLLPTELLQLQAAQDQKKLDSVLLSYNYLAVIALMHGKIK